MTANVPQASIQTATNVRGHVRAQALAAPKRVSMCNLAWMDESSTATVAGVKFAWDPAKDRANQAKHGVSFTEAATVFDDPLQWTIADPDHSLGESRYLTTGYASAGQLLIVAHTEEDDVIRIISARMTTNAERHVYEEGD